MSLATALWLCSVFVSTVRSIQTHYVYWNSTNPLFRIDNTKHVIDVNQGNLPWEYDQLNIICPFGTSERHIIYSVTKEEFDSCRVSNPRPKIVAVCDRPERFKYFTITFRSFSPTPGGLEFRPGQSYYFVSTATRKDIHRRVGGFCSTHNMKMIFNVAQKDSDDLKSNTIVVNQPRKLGGGSTTQLAHSTPPSSSRLPVYRKVGFNWPPPSDRIYYYKPWHKKKHQRKDNQVTKAEKLTSSAFRVGSGLISTLLVSFLLLC